MTEPRDPYHVHSRRPTNPGRQDSLTGPTPPRDARRESWAKEASEISAIEELINEHRVALQEQQRQFAAQARMEITRTLKQEESAEMTMLKRQRKSAVTTAATLAAILVSSTAVLITRLATWADAREAAIVPAHEAKAVAAGVEERVGRGEERLDGVESSLSGIERDMGVLSRKLDRVIDELESQPGKHR